MIDNPESVRLVIENLFNKNQNKLAFDLLDYYYTVCQSIAEYELIGQLALKNSYVDMSVKCAENVYTLSVTAEQLYISRMNLYKAYNAANRPKEALFYNKLNLEITPDDFDTNVFYAGNLKLNGQRLKGEKIIERITKGASKEQLRSVRSSHSHKLFRKGQIGKGIDLFLGVNLQKETSFHLMGMKRWDGTPKKGKNLYIYEGGGVGDTFINIRFMQHIKELGMNPIFYSNLGRDDVLDVLYRNGFEVITRLDDIDLEAPHTESMCLPVDLNVKEKDLWYGPYLKAKKDPKNDLGPKKKFRIGIKCNGNPYFAQDIYRSIPIDQMLGAIPENVEVYYFDVDKQHDGVINLKDRISNWEDTLDYIDQMDLIMSSCTSLPHISGAMGKPTIVIPPIAEYYIWSSSRTDDKSPWYGSNFHVFKQQKVHSWKEPLAKATKLINKMIGENNAG